MSLFFIIISRSLFLFTSLISPSRWFIFHVQNCGQNPERFCGKKKSNGCTHQLTHRSKYTICSRRYLNKFFEFANVLIYLVATDSYNDISSRIWKKRPKQNRIYVLINGRILKNWNQQIYKLDPNCLVNLWDFAMYIAFIDCLIVMKRQKRKPNNKIC